MIGLKLKNSVWEKALSDLLKNKAEIYQQGKNYAAILTDFPPKEKKPVFICLGCSGGTYQLTLPLKKGDLELLLATISTPLHNALFVWNSEHRQLQNKKTKDKIQLTEKEASLIDFLNECPQKEATKTELLQNVWRYTDGTDTHTVETTIYSLRQKLKKDADKLIVSTKNGYRLV